MKYKEYIDLGFSRFDCDDDVEFNNTGFGGFSLTKDFGKGTSISVSSDNLLTPKLYIEKNTKETFHIIPISTECLKDFCKNNK